MAYKFQRGPATASGSFTAEEGLISTGSVLATSDISSSAALLVGTSATVGNGLTVTAGGAQITGSTYISGAAGLNVVGQISGSGILQIGGGGDFGNKVTVAVGNLQLKNGGLDVTGSSVISGAAGLQVVGPLSGSGTLQVGGTSTLQALNAQATTATTLSASSTLQVGGTSTLQTLNAQATTTTTLSGTTAQMTILSASNLGGAAFANVSNLYVPNWDAGNGRFEDSYISRNGFGQTIISGAQGLAVTGAVGVVGAATISNGLTVSAGGLTVSSGDSSVQKLTVNGDLIVLGDTFSASVGTLLIEDKQIVLADGATNASLAYGAGFFVSGANVEWTFKQNGEGTAASSGDIFVASSSAGLIDIQAASFYGSLVGSVSTPVQAIGDENKNLALGVNYSTASLTAIRTWSLPAASVGDSVKIKAPANCGNAPSGFNIIIAGGSATIDGESTVTLESPYAAIECVYVATNTWSVF